MTPLQSSYTYFLKAKDWLLILPKGTNTSLDECTNLFMTKFSSPTKTMQLGSNITCFSQQDREPLALAWERIKEVVMNCPSHGMEEWRILHLFYNALNPMSKSTLDTITRGTFMGKQVDVANMFLRICKTTMPNDMWRALPKNV
jgi:hypothetical protein